MSPHGCPHEQECPHFVERSERAPHRRVHRLVIELRVSGHPRDERLVPERCEFSGWTTGWNKIADTCSLAHSKTYPWVPKALKLAEHWQRYWQLLYPSPTFTGRHPAPTLLYKVACRKNVYHNLIVHTTSECSVRFSLPSCQVKP